MIIPTNDEYAPDPDNIEEVVAQAIAVSYTEEGYVFINEENLDNLRKILDGLERIRGELLIKQIGEDAFYAIGKTRWWVREDDGFSTLKIKQVTRLWGEWIPMARRAIESMYKFHGKKHLESETDIERPTVTGRHTR